MINNVGVRRISGELTSLEKTGGPLESLKEMPYPVVIALVTLLVTAIFSQLVDPLIRFLI